MIADAERRESAVAYWFNVVRPRIAVSDAKPKDTPDQARARLLELSGMSQADFDAIPDAKQPSTFQKPKVKV